MYLLTPPCEKGIFTARISYRGRTLDSERAHHALCDAQQAMPSARRTPYNQDTEDTVSSSCFGSLFSFRSNTGSKTTAKRDGTNPEQNARRIDDPSECSVSLPVSLGSNCLSTSTPGARCILCGAGKLAVNDKSSDCALCGTKRWQRVTTESWASESSASSSSRSTRSSKRASV